MRETRREAIEGISTCSLYIIAVAGGGKYTSPRAAKTGQARKKRSPETKKSPAAERPPRLQLFSIRSPQS
jgi:hypothetical protein